MIIITNFISMASFKTQLQCARKNRKAMKRQHRVKQNVIKQNK